ncbi:replication initiation factor domain-containing protein [Methylolobus aquaticus]
MNRSDPSDPGRGHAGRGGARPDAPAPGAAATAELAGCHVDAPLPASPREVIRGESTCEDAGKGVGDAALIDWLNVTFPHVPKRGSRVLDAWLVEDMERIFGIPVGSKRKSGHLGYTDSWELGHRVGILAQGGASQGGTCFLSLSGEACALVPNWLAVHGWLVQRDAKITRVDLAHDDYAGVFDIATGLGLLATGGFTTGGRPPTAKYVDDLGSGQGKTLYVGSRSSGKLLRIYEKGRQLGDPDSPWVRWELELHSVDRIIPRDVLLRPGVYLAGAYPCMSWVSETQERIRTHKARFTISFERLIHYARKSYGKLIWFLSNILGWDAARIVETLSVEGTPARFVMSGFPLEPEETTSKDDSAEVASP